MARDVNKINGAGEAPENDLRELRKEIIEATNETAEQKAERFERMYENERRKNIALTEQNKELRRLITTDELTGVENKRGLRKHLAEILAEMERNKHSVTVAMIDIDHFKQVNDTKGHGYGDKVLAGVAKALRGNVRGYDAVARYGGEEFTIIFPEAGVEEISEKLEELRTKIEGGVELEDGTIANITISLGACEKRAENKMSMEELLERADKALYEAKNTGRNKVVIAK